MSAPKLKPRRYCCCEHDVNSHNDSGGCLRMLYPGSWTPCPCRLFIPKRRATEKGRKP